MRHARRVILMLTGLLLLLPVVLVGLVVVALRTPWVEAEVRERVRTALADATGARVSIGALRATLLAGVRAREVSLVFPAGARVSAPDVTASLSLPVLLGGRIALAKVRANGLRVRLRPDAPDWGFAGLDDAAGDDDEPLPALRVRQVVIEGGRVDVGFEDRPIALDQLALDAGFAMDATGIRVDVAHLAAVPRGVAVTPLALAGRLAVGADGGDVAVHDVALATRRSRLAGSGRLVTDRRIAAHLDGALSARELRALVPGLALASDLTGTLAARGPWRRVGVRAALATPASGGLRLFGLLDAGTDDLRYRAAARLRGLDLAALDPALPASVLRGHVRVRGALASLDRPLALRLGLAPSAIAGQAVERARLAGRIDAAGLDAGGAVDVPGGRATIDGRLDWRNDLAYRARARARIDDLARFVPDLAGRGRLRATIDGRGVEAPGRDATARIAVEAARIGGVRLERGGADVVLRGDVLRLTAGELDAAGLRAQASGTFDLARRQLDAAIAVAGDLARAAGLGGTVTGSLAVRGPLDALALEGRATAAGVRGDGATLERAALDFALRGVGSDAPGGRVTLEVAGMRAGELGPWSGDLAGEWRRSAGVDAAAVTLRAADAAGARLAGRAAVRRPGDGRLSAEVPELTLAPADQPAWTLAAPARIAFSDGTLAIDRLELAADAQRASLTGTIGRTGPSDLRLAWRDLDLEPLCGLADVACAGRSAGNARLSGMATDPTLDVTARADGLAVDGSPVATATVSARYGARALGLRGVLAQVDAGRLEVSGTIPIDLAWQGPRRDLSGAAVDLALRTDGLDLRVLRLLAPGAIRESGGRLAADLNLRGPWRDLRASGPISLRDGRIALAATGVTYEGVELSAAARGDTVELQSLRARAGDGSLEGAGTIALAAGATAPLGLRLRFADFLAVALPGYEAATDGVLRIDGSLGYPVVRGQLVLTRLLVRPAVLADVSGPSLEPDPTIEVVGLPAPAPEPEAPALDPGETLSLDVGVRVVRDAWIRRADADVELRGELRLGKAPHGPLFVTGEVRLVRGWYAFQGRRFEVGDSRIVFGGEVPPDPQLDIRAINRTAGYEVTVEIGGRASEPALALSSSPPLEQADILSLLVFGRPARDLGRGESLDLQRQALSLASGYVMPELRQSMMATLDLDTLEVGDEGVRAGRYVTRDVFVTLAQDFTGRAGQTMGVEYAITRRLSLKLSTSTQGTSAMDLLWRRRY